MDNLYKFEELTPREQVMVGQAMGWDGTTYHAPDGVKVTPNGEGQVAMYSVEYPEGIERSAAPVNGVTEPAPELPADAATDNLPVPEPTTVTAPTVTAPQDIPSTDNGVGTSTPTDDGQAPTNDEIGQGTDSGVLTPATEGDATQLA
jgi:hypothetical protein